MTYRKTDLILAFEGGGSKTRILLADCEGNRYASELGASSSRLYVDPARYVDATARLLRRVKRAADKVGGRVRTAGLAGPMDWKLATRAIRSVFGRIPCVRTGEGDIALALYDLRVGISLVAGTGSSCRGLNERGKSVSCGGFGPQFDDVGSGYWIGREAITAVVHARDGRGPQTLLDELLRKYLNIKDLWEVHRHTNGGGHLFPPTVAGFTPHVFAAARDGDGPAMAICKRAGRTLGELVVTVARQADIRTRPIPLVYTGGVFHGGPLILNPLRRELRKGGYAFREYLPAPEPIMGIVKLMAQQERGKTRHVS